MNQKIITIGLIILSLTLIGCSNLDKGEYDPYNGHEVISVRGESSRQVSIFGEHLGIDAHNSRGALLYIINKTNYFISCFDITYKEEDQHLYTTCCKHGKLTKYPIDHTPSGIQKLEYEEVYREDKCYATSLELQIKYINNP